MMLGVYSDLGFYGAQETTAQLSVTINSRKTSRTRPTITGTISTESATVMVQVSGGAEYQAVVSGTSWYIKLGPLPVGAYTITATALDNESGESVSASSSLIITPSLSGANINTSEFAGISNLVTVR